LTIVVEACVESVDEALTAERGGADRLELCDNMAAGGTTPDASVIDDVKRRVGIPVAVMIRPRGGSFVFNLTETEKMRRDIAMARAHGADMLVIGVLAGDHTVEADVTRELVELAAGTPVTFHKAFDRIVDQPGALDVLIDAGVSRVLTSGGAPTALEGAESIAALVQRAAGRITIMAGGKVRGHNARQIVERTAVIEVHARCNLESSRIGDIVAALGTISPA
jgi:copper homeostasis protein